MITVATYVCRVTRQDTEVLWSPAWDHNASTKCTGKLVRHSHNLKFPTVLLLDNTTPTVAILMECDSVAVGVRTEGMKLLTMVSIKIIQGGARNVIPFYHPIKIVTS